MQRRKKNFTSPSTSQHPNPSNQDEPLFFYMPDAVHGEFCQWFPSTFTITKAEISSLIGHPVDDPLTDLPTNTTTSTSDSITFTHAEQFMMYCKALRFHDVSTAHQILSSASPKEQKRLGKLTTGFTDASWDEVKGSVVLAGNIAKFGQNPKLKGKLLATGSRELVEAASRDRVWGIGCSEKHALRFRGFWGENRLGKALMEVRERLRKEDGVDGEDWEGGWERLMVGEGIFIGNFRRAGY